MIKKLPYLIILLFIIQSFVTSKNKKNKISDSKKQPADPKSYKPNQTTPELWCDACNAIVRETHKILRGKTSEADVYDLTEDICNPERYYTYSNNYD